MKKKLVAVLLTGAMVTAMADRMCRIRFTRAVMQKKVIRSELNSLQSMVPLITAGKVFKKDWKKKESKKEIT